MMRSTKEFTSGITCLFAIGLLFTCRPVDPLEKALFRAGNNRVELEKALSFYRQASKQDDTARLKFDAVKFLICNMNNKYYVSGSGVDEFNRFIDSVYQIKRDVYDISTIYSQFREQAKFRHPQHYSMYWDLEQLKCDFILNHVESAFKARQKPWAKHLSFDEFCEYLLPYRISNEAPELWRSLYYDRFHHLLPDTALSVRQCCDIVNDILIRSSPQIAIQSVNKSAIRPSSMINMKFGQCNDYTSFAVYIMRSLGIPAGMATIPHWGNNNNGHSFNILLEENGNLADFSGAFERCGNGINGKGHAKIYQLMFGIQNESLAVIHGDEPIPDFFKNPCIKDITGHFPKIGIRDISLSFHPKSKTKKRKFAYLCVFDPQGWCPIDWGSISNGKVTFKNVGTGVVYQLATCNLSGVIPVGNPFLLDTMGAIIEFSPHAEKIRMTLTRKKEVSSSLLIYPSLIIGGKFQGANTPDFQDAEDLHVIDYTPDFAYKTIPVSSNRSFQYLRYLFTSVAQGNMAEIKFYDSESSEKLHGEVIGDYIPSIYYPLNSPEKMFDDDALSFFHTIEDRIGWGGIKLDKPAKISKIRYIIRNDDNGIREGELYELFYMQDGQWISMGKKMATKDDILVYEHVPGGALYWLKNHTKGREERPFTYENGQQVWW